MVGDRLGKVGKLSFVLGSGLVGGSGLVSGRSGLVGLGFVLGVDSLAFVFDISDITVVVVSGVGDDLGTAVGEGNGVRSGHNLSVRVFGSAELGTRITVIDGIGVRVGLGFVSGFLVCGSGLVGRGGFVGGCGLIGTGKGHEGSEGNVTKHVVVDLSVDRWKLMSEFGNPRVFIELEPFCCLA